MSKASQQGRGPAERIRELREQIEHHNHLYHVQARPQISDREFDRLCRS
jgi:DNA ligase (NAD+)